MICDFCSSREVYAVYDCGVRANWKWYVCRDCHDLIVAARRNDLLERSIASFPLNDVHALSMEFESDLREFHAGFWTYRSGDWHELPVSPPVDFPSGKVLVDVHMALRKVDEPGVTIPLPVCILLTDLAPQGLAARLAPCDRCNVQKWFATCQQPLVDSGVPMLCRECVAYYLSILNITPTV